MQSVIEPIELVSVSNADEEQASIWMYCRDQRLYQIDAQNKTLANYFLLDVPCLTSMHISTDRIFMLDHKHVLHQFDLK
ncbi:hypothetical protein Ciccas_013233 [Cichlidogyrus casuarinus]|uniref:Uncharacterized protein n=1 Tax=Cichlidogyrus casuarinus TaxID=1844966 RepID=A0ABD2PMK5_9PLAT